MSAKEVGVAINSPVRTIENWAAGGRIQQNSAGKYGLVSAFTYKLQGVEGKLNKAQVDIRELSARLNANSQEARERKAIAEADKEVALARIKELELEKIQGKLVDADEVLAIWERAIANSKAKLIGIPNKVALELSGMEQPEDIRNRLTEVIDEALVELTKPSR